MNDTGLLSINGIPGSGKTLLSVIKAKRHFKKENSIFKYYTAKFKYYIIQQKDKFKFLFIIIDFFKKIFSYKIFNNVFIKFLLFLIKWFINIFLFTCLFFKFSIYFKAFIIFYLFFLKKFIKSFNDLDYKYFKIFPYEKINNVYSTFPILLDKKRQIYSNSIDLFDMDSKWSFFPNALIIIDEVQLFVDSDEYSDKVKKKLIARIAKFLQAHRHFGIKQIIFISQSPSRIFKKARNITIGYLKLFKVINFPLGISLMRGVIYYDFEYYGRYIPRDREERKKLPFEYKKVYVWFFRGLAYRSYDSRYLSNYNYGKPLLERGTWNNMKVDYEFLKTMFEEND